MLSLLKCIFAFFVNVLFRILYHLHKMYFFIVSFPCNTCLCFELGTVFNFEDHWKGLCFNGQNTPGKTSRFGTRDGLNVKFSPSQSLEAKDLVRVQRS